MIQVYVYDGHSRQRLSFSAKADCLLTQEVYPSLSDDLYLKAAEDKVFYQYEEKPGVLKNGIRIAGLTFFVTLGNYTYYKTKGLDRVVVGPRLGSHLVLEDKATAFLLDREGRDWVLSVLSGAIYVNNHLVTERDVLPYGAELAFEDRVFKVFPDELWGLVPDLVESRLQLLEQSAYAFYEDYPDYHRSPRLIYRSSEEKVQVNAPSAEPQKPRNEILKMIIPPLVMIGVTLLISIFQPRGLYIIMSVVSSIMTTIFSVQNYFKSKRDYKESLANRISAYEAYLSDKAVQLTALATKQRQGQGYHFPGPEEVGHLAETYSHRIYEKTPQQFDFLYYRLGLGEVVTSYQLTYSQTERSGIKDPLEVEGYSLYQRHRFLADMPIVANLMHGPVGYVGDRALVLEQLQLLVRQITLFHSYHEVQVVTVMPEAEKGLWDWMRWLPHARLQGLNVRGFVYNQRSRDQVLNSLNQILKQRQTEAREPGRQDQLFSPHYVVLITDKSLIMDHVIMEFFNEDPTALGCSLVFVEDVLSSLSENIKTVVTIQDGQTGTLLMEEGVLREVAFHLDHLPEGTDLEDFSRVLAPLNHLRSLKSSIPEAVTFLELYGVERVEELDVSTRWAKHSPYKSLAVPLGLRGQEDIVSLNLHEKAHGPHGLVAGTTGSGKSEILQSYILSLAVNFHPHDVAFLLIDYKGGGMANLFKDLPHLLGTITNLDGAQSMRALTSIKAELKRRQKLFSVHEVNHINQYQKKVKLGEATEPMPHLFLISDEFAELKQNQPDFMAELVSTARIGRSLGIHLILATQKPSGVVNDQIWSNSRFKLALKVADRADSQEMLKTPDAADITQAGRAYLQVGNNEVYELFQSAWSGADYEANKSDQGIEDQTIYAINELGQYEILNQDLSGLEVSEDIHQVPTELDAVVSYIHDTVAKAQIPALAQPWLPPLKERVVLSDLAPVSYEEAWATREGQDMILHLGMGDFPERQAQEVVSLNLSQDGHVLLYGSVGTGKTTFLQTSVMDLAKHRSPDFLNFYLLDFGSNGLAPLSRLPHVADRITIDQTEKIVKFMTIITEEIGKRKSLLSDYGVSSIEQYIQVSDNVIPSLVIMLDSYEAIKDEPIEEDLFKLLVRLSREGLSVGIHVMMTAGRQSNLRPTLYSNFKHQLLLYLNDSSDVVSVVGRSPYNEMDDTKGRGLMKLDEVTLVQFALPVTAENDVAILEALRKESAEMRAYWTGQVPEGIPMLPSELSEASFMTQHDSAKKALANGLIPLGLDKETVKARSWHPRQGNLLYLYDKDTELSQMASYLINRVQESAYKLALVLPELSFLDKPEGETVYDTAVGYGELIAALSRQMENRIKERRTKVTHVILWPNYDEVIPHLGATQLEQLRNFFEKGPAVGYVNVIMTRPSNLSKLQDQASRVVKLFKQSLLAVRIADQVIVSPTNRPLKEAMLSNQENYFMTNGVVEKIMVPIR